MFLECRPRIMGKFSAFSKLLRQRPTSGAIHLADAGLHTTHTHTHGMESYEYELLNILYNTVLIKYYFCPHDTANTQLKTHAQQNTVPRRVYCTYTYMITRCVHYDLLSLLLFLLLLLYTGRVEV